MHPARLRCETSYIRVSSSFRALPGRRRNVEICGLIFFEPPKLSEAGTAKADADAVEPGADTAADSDPIDEQRGRAASGGKAALDEFVTVDEIGTIDVLILC